MSNDTVEEGSAATLSNSNSTGDFLIGFGITIAAAALNAFGLNLTKLDHAKASEVPRSKRRKEFLRPLWLLGMFSYIISQLVGSTLALEFLRSEYVAPLGSSSLIFNFLFARILVHTKISRTDVIGTFLIIVGVVGVVAFGNQRSKDSIDTEANLNLDTLEELWSKAPWLIFFILLEVLTAISWWLASISDEVLKEREELDSDQERPEEDRYIRGGGGRKPTDPNANSFLASVDKVREGIRKVLKGSFAQWATRQPDANVKRIGGFLWSVVAGLLASQTLIFAKSAVKLFSTQANHPDRNQFASFLSIFILILLAATAVAQVFCLNRGLAVADSTVVVPSMFAIYSGFGFANSLFYLDELNVYSKTITAMIVLSMLVLLVGVGILSSKKIEAPLKKPRPDLEGTPGEAEEPSAAATEADTSRAHDEDDEPGSGTKFVEGAKAKLQDAVSRINFSSPRTPKPQPGSQLLGKGVDRMEDDERSEMHELPVLDRERDRRRDSDDTIEGSPFDDPVKSSSRRRNSFDSFESGETFGQFETAKH